MRSISQSCIRNRQTWSCLGSGFVHVVTLGGVFVGQLWLQLHDATPAVDRSSRIVIQGGFLPWREAVDESRPIEFEDSASAPASTATPGFVEGKVSESIAEARSLTLDEQLEQLKRRSAELSGGSSAESIDQMAKRINALLGTKPRAAEPAAEPVDGSFDFDTAQMHEVCRESLEVGGYRYRTVLVDSRGRQFETEVDAETGEQLYKVFEIIRGNPLLEKVYRQVVMGLLDKLSQPKGFAELPPVP